jgi:hypothetical protein
VSSNQCTCSDISHIQLNLCSDAALYTTWGQIGENYKIQLSGLADFTSGLHYCIFDLETNPIFDKTAIKQA